MQLAGWLDRRKTRMRGRKFGCVDDNNGARGRTAQLLGNNARGIAAAALLLGFTGSPASGYGWCGTPPSPALHGYLLQRRRYTGRPTSSVSLTSGGILLLAKTPPTAQFNLEAIEALEQRLLLQEQQPEEASMLRDGKDDDNIARGHLWGDDDWEPEEGPAEEISAVAEVTVPPQLDGTRVDAALAALFPHLSRSFCGILVEEGRVSWGDCCRDEESDASDLQRAPATAIRRKSFAVRTGQVLYVEMRSPDEGLPSTIVPQDLPLDVLFEDEHIIVLNKAAHMVVHPGAGNPDGTVVNALAYHYLQSSNNDGGTPWDAENLLEGMAASLRPGIVHRLDKGTTGVLVAAKTAVALAALSEQFEQRLVRKTYLAITVGNPGRNVTIDKPIARHPTNRQMMRVVPEVHRDSDKPSRAGRRAVSYVQTLAFDGQLSLVQVRIVTGRTHQIRVHLQDRKTPIYGDSIYGLADWNRRLGRRHGIQDRPLLHAHQLQLQHPATGEALTFTAPLPPDFVRVLRGVYPQGPQERPDLFSWGEATTADASG